MDFFVLGEEEIIIGFNVVGIQGRLVTTRDEALEGFRYALSLPQLKILILTEEAASLIGEEVTEWNMSGKFPLLVEIPGIQGRMEGKKTLVQSIREAVGISV
ncbi:MAG: ATPase V [Spirochaetales bacterium]|jgi:V/A-type H+-transporting ATPase subunit F|nr:ATPase V [Spirochaetales bacterium]